MVTIKSLQHTRQKVYHTGLFEIFEADKKYLGGTVDSLWLQHWWMENGMLPRQPFFFLWGHW